MISFSEILVVLLVALLVIKPENLPEAAYTLGKWLKWFRQASNHIKRAVEEPLEKLTHEQPETNRLKTADEQPHE